MMPSGRGIRRYLKSMIQNPLGGHKILELKGLNFNLISSPPRLSDLLGKSHMKTVVAARTSLSLT